MPNLPASRLVDGAVDLPNASSRSFWLAGSAWQFPEFGNLDVFVARLIRAGLLVHEPAVGAALNGQRSPLSDRSIQRHFRRTTGVTLTAVRQINRARYATVLLQEGTPILDVVEAAGYYDQPHLTRSLRYFIGQTPAQLQDPANPEQLSLLYKTDPPR